MGRFIDGMKVRLCGCVVYEYGPPFKCDKHATREQVLEEKGLRKAVREQAATHGHDLTFFAEYESRPGKWTAHCNRCFALVIVYDDVPERGDQINGRKVLEEECQP